MPRDITVTFADGSSHVYENAPDSVTPDQAESRVSKDFPNKKITNMDGGKGTSPQKSAIANDPNDLLNKRENPKAEEKPESISQKIKGAGEALATVASGATAGQLGQVAGFIKGIGQSISQGTYGTQKGIRDVEKSTEAGGKEFTTEPKTPTGQRYVENVSKAIESSEIGKIPISEFPAIEKAASSLSGAASLLSGAAIDKTVRATSDAAKAVIRPAAQKIAQGAQVVGRNIESSLKVWTEDHNREAANIFKRVKGVDQMTDSEKQTAKSIIMQKLSASETMANAESDITKALEEHGMSLQRDAEMMRKSAVEMEARKAEAVNAIGPDRALSDIGKEAQDTGLTNLEKIRETRSARADANFKEVEQVAGSKEASGVFAADLPSYGKLLSRLKTEVASQRDAGTVRQLNELIAALSPREKAAEGVALLGADGKPLSAPKLDKPQVKALEVIRRKLGDRGNGLPAEGYDAIGTKFANEAKNELSSIISEFTETTPGSHSTSAFRKYLNDYAKDSKPLDPFRTQRGGKLTDVEEFDWSQAKQDPIKVAKHFLDSEQGARQFVDVLGGNRYQAESLIRSYLTNQLSGKTAKEASSFISKGGIREVLNEFPVIEKSVRVYLDHAKVAETKIKSLQSSAVVMDAQAAKVFENRNNISTQIQKAIYGNTSKYEMEKLADSVRNVPGGMDALHDAVRLSVSKMSAEDFLKVAGPIRRYEDQIRPAIAASGLSPNELSKLDNVVEHLRNLDKVETLKANAFTPEIEKSTEQVKRSTAISAYLTTIPIAVTGTGSLAGAGLALAEGAGLYGIRNSKLMTWQKGLKSAIDEMIKDPSVADEYLAKPTPKSIAKVRKLFKLDDKP